MYLFVYLFIYLFLPILLQLFCATIASQTETFHPVGMSLKEESKQLKISPSSSWNWLHLLGSSLPEYAIKAESPPGMRERAELSRRFSQKKSYKAWDQTSCLEGAKPSQDAWKKFRTEIVGKTRSSEMHTSTELDFGGIHTLVCRIPTCYQ